MRLLVRLADPKNSKERMFRAEAVVDDLKDPGEAYVMLNGREYLVEIHYEFPRMPSRKDKADQPSLFPAII